MIQFFRNMFSSKLGVVIAILFIGLIGLAFALADISAPTNMFTGGGEEIATVGDESVTEEPVAQFARRALESERADTPGLDMAAFIEAGGLDEVIDQYTRAIALSAFAGDADILVGKALVDATLAETPTFQGMSGTFDENSFREFLRRNNVTEEEIRTDIERQTLFRLVLGPVAAAAQIPATVARPFASLLLEERRGQVIAVPAVAVAQGPAPSQADLDSFYRDNMRRYTLPERRAVRYAAFSRDQIPEPTPTEQQVREYYAENDDRFGGSDRRTLRQIVLPNEAQANAFYAAVNGGTDFVEAAGERGFSASSTEISASSESEFARATSEAVASAAFGAGQGDLLRPIRSGLGWHVIRVETVEQNAGRSLATVRPQIVQELTEQLADETLADFYLAIENAIDGGATFEEIAQAQGLTIETTPPLAPNGMAPSEPGYRPGPDIAMILEGAFSMGEDEDPILIELEENQRYAMLDVTDVQQSAPQPLSSIRQLVMRDFIADRAMRRSRNAAAQIAERINGGASPQEALAAAEIDLPAPQPIQSTRRAMATTQNPPAPLRLMFQMAENTAKLVRLSANQGWFVVVLEDIESNEEQLTPQAVEQTRRQFGRVVSNEYAEQFLNAVRADYPLERDEAAIEAMSNRLLGRAR